MITNHLISRTRQKAGVACIGLVCLVGQWAFPASVAGKLPSRVIRIGIGRMNSAEWVSTLTHKRGKGLSNVCVSTALAVEKNSGVNISEAFECDSVRADLPFIQLLGDHSKNGPRSVFAEIFSPAVTRVVVDLGKGTGSTVQLRRPSKNNARELGIEQVGYWVHAFSGPLCIQDLTAYDRLGDILSQGKLGCP